MTNRNLIAVALLTLFTCGIYWLYWLYVTTKELKDVSGRGELNPTVDVLLAIVTCFIWGIYAEYRNAQIVHQVQKRRGVAHEDKSNLVLIMNLLALLVGITGLIAVIVLQEDYNRLAAPAAAAT